MARSLTVPSTASVPMSPPGKNNGWTTNESVVKASRHPADVEHRAVVAPGERGTAQRRHEDPLDQLMHQFAATTVGHGHGALIHNGHGAG